MILRDTAQECPTIRKHAQDQHVRSVRHAPATQQIRITFPAHRLQRGASGNVQGRSFIARPSASPAGRRTW